MSNLLFTWNEILSATRGSWLIEPVGEGIVCVEDDSRKVASGALFVAIVGEIADGHAYVAKAAEAGAAAVCVQRRLEEAVMARLSELHCGCLLVEDGMRAFQALANAHRRRFPKLPVVAITGSCGKTSSKEMCAAVLEAHWPSRVLKTTGNTNNFFGVPRNLFRIGKDTAAAVIEAGTNHPGEIATLAAVIEPTAAVITCIGAAHLEFFHDFNGVAEEKGDIFQALPEGAAAVMPADCAGKDILLKHAAGRKVVTFGLSEGADVRAIYGGLTENGYALALVRKDTGERVDLVWGIGGECQAGNAAAAAAIGISLGMSLAECAEGLKHCELPGARMNEKEIGGVHWANDAYNANPSSMVASMNWFREASAKASSRFVLLGDMLELGESSADMHRSVLEKALELFPNDAVITIGPRFAPFAEKRGLTHFDDIGGAKTLSYPQGAWVFLKGSFGMGLYKLVPEG